MFGFLVELPGTFATMLRRTYSPAAGADSGPFHLPDAGSIVTFLDFYQHIEKFRRENPSLQFAFLDEHNIKVLKGLADLYEGINDYMPPEDQNAVKEYNAIQRKREEYQAFDQSAFKRNTENREIKRVVSIIKHTNDLVDYKTLILGLGHSDPQDNLFSQLRNLPANASASAQNEIHSIEAVWNRRRHLAYLTSGSMLTVSRVLDKFETYLGMIDAEFILNENYSQRVYEFWHGLSEEKKQCFNQLIIKAKDILARERQNLAQAMICRLELVSREHLMAAASNESAAQHPLYDDIVLATSLSLQKFGLAKVLGLQKFRAKSKGDLIARFRRIARFGLTYGLMRDFFAYIIRYGCDAQKQDLSELFNGRHYFGEDISVHAEEQDPAVNNNPDEASQKPADVRVPDETGSSSPVMNHQAPPAIMAMETIFPQLKAAATRYFAAARFRDHDELHAAFLEKAIQFVENNGADCNIPLACEQVYSHVVRSHIRTIADRLFPDLSDEKTRQSFIAIAEYLFLCLGAERDFDERVSSQARIYILAIREAARQVHHYARAASMDEINAELLQNQFILYASNGLIRHNGNLEIAIAEAKFDAYVFVQAEWIKERGMAEHFVREFSRNCKTQILSNNAKWLMADADLCRWIEKQKQFMLAKCQFIQLFQNENARIRSSLRQCSMFVSSQKTLSKLNAMAAAVVRMRDVSSFADLRRVAHEISNDQAVTQKRSIFSFLERRSTSKRKILGEIERMEHALPAI